MEKESLLILRDETGCTAHQLKKLHEYICEQRKTGVIVLPVGTSLVDIRYDEGSDKHEIGYV